MFQLNQNPLYALFIHPFFILNRNTCALSTISRFLPAPVVITSALKYEIPLSLIAMRILGLHKNELLRVTLKSVLFDLFNEFVVTISFRGVTQLSRFSLRAVITVGRKRV